jgi:hypothetical protein
VALVAVVACTGAIRMHEWSVTGAGRFLWRSVNQQHHHGKDAAAERLCSTFTHGEVASYNPLKCCAANRSARPKGVDT